MKIRHKLLSAFLSLFLIIGLMGLYAGWRNHLVSQKLLFIHEGSVQEVLAASGVAVYLHASYSGVQELLEEALRERYINQDEDFDDDEFRLAKEKISATLNGVPPLLESLRLATVKSITLSEEMGDEELERDEQEELVVWHQAVATAFSAYRQTILSLTRLIDEGKILEATELLESDVESIYRQRLLPLISDFQNDGREELDQEVEEILKTIEQVQNSMGLGVVLLLAVALLTSVILALRISRPLVRLCEAASQIQAGIAAEPFASSSNDEIGHLTTVFFEMVATEKEHRRNIEEAQLALEKQSTTLEKNVADRTATLAATNARLSREIEDHQATEIRLVESLRDHRSDHAGYGWLGDHRRLAENPAGCPDHPSQRVR